jgi:hypothetical protein
MSAKPTEDEVRGLSWIMRVAAEHAVLWGWSKEHWLRLAAYWWAVANREDYVDPYTGEVKEVP